MTTHGRPEFSRTLRPQWLLLFALGACATPPVERTLDSLSDIADSLVARLEQRSDPRNLRVLVHEIHEIHGSAGRHGPSHQRAHNETYRNAAVAVEASSHRTEHADVVQNLLQHEFVVHLTSRLNMRLEVRRSLLVPLEQRVRVFRGQTPFALKVLLDLSGSHREISIQQRDPIVENVYVRQLMADVEQRGYAA